MTRRGEWDVDLVREGWFDVTVAPPKPAGFFDVTFVGALIRDTAGVAAGLAGAFATPSGHAGTTGLAQGQAGAQGSVHGVGVLVGTAQGVSGAHGTPGAAARLLGAAQAQGGALAGLRGHGALIGQASAVTSARMSEALFVVAQAVGGAHGAARGGAGTTGVAAASAGAIAVPGSPGRNTGRASGVGGAEAVLRGLGLMIGQASAVGGAIAQLGEHVFTSGVAQAVGGALAHGIATSFRGEADARTSAHGALSPEVSSLDLNAPLPFDPQTTAILSGILATMADDRQFLLQSAPSRYRYLDTRFPLARSCVPTPGEEALVVGYQILYRRQTFRGHMVAGQSSVSLAMGILAQDALFQVRLYDEQHPVTEYSISEVGGP